MKNLVINPTQLITRTVLQTILYRALAASETVACAGVLGVVRSDKQGTIQYAECIDSGAVLENVLASWRSSEIQCIGCFCLQHQTLPKYVSDVMLDQYIKLSVGLDDVGRLDVLAQYCHQKSQETTALSLNLIEDGHAVADE